MASTGIIPTYQRFVNGTPVPPAPKRSFRPREKYLILLVLITFVIVCFGAFFDLPEYKASNTVNNVYIKVYEQLQNAPQLLMPPPPHSNDIHSEIGIVRHGDAVVLDPHKLEDRVKLLAKIEQDEMNQKVLERPNLVNSNEVIVNKETVIDKSVMPPRLSEEHQETVQTSKIQLPVIQGGEDQDPVARERRNKIKQVSDKQKPKVVKLHSLLDYPSGYNVETLKQECRKNYISRNTADFICVTLKIPKSLSKPLESIGNANVLEG